MINNSQIVIYQNDSGEVKLDMRFDGDTVWLAQKLMSELFDVSVANINMHIENIFDERELAQNLTDWSQEPPRFAKIFHWFCCCVG